MKSHSLLLLTLVACLTSISAKSASRDVGSSPFQPRSHVDTTSLPSSSGKPTRVLPSQKSGIPVLPTLTTRGGEVSYKMQEFLGAGAFLVMNEIFRAAFTKYDIKFPAMLGGCLILFAFLVLTELLRTGTGDYLFNLLVPGSGFLAKWLPVFFVPGLAMLPKAPSVGGGLDVLKVISVVGIGYLFSLCTTGYSVQALRKALGAIAEETPVPVKARGGSSAPAKPYSQETLDFLVKGSILTAAISIAASRTNNEFATPLRTIFFGISTIAAYVWGARLPADFTKVVHPLVIATALTLSFVYLYGLATDSSFMDVLSTYKVGSLAPSKAGAGDILLHLLGPCVLSFATSMYSRKKLLQENLFVVLFAMLVSSVGGLFGTAFFANLIGLGGSGGKLVRLSVLPRNVTTALAIAISNILGGDISITASVVVLTGIVAATYSRTILDKLGIKDPITRGLAVGSAGQGLGVASMIPEPDAFPFAAMAMVLTAVCSTTLVSISSVKDVIIDIATSEKAAAAAAATATTV